MSGVISVVIALSFTATAVGGTYKVGTPNNQLVSMGTVFDCRTSLYDPEVQQLSDGTLRLWGQGGSSTSCSRGIDSIYIATYNPSTNRWTVPSATQCPPLTGVRVCDHLPTIPDETGPVASPTSSVKIGNKFYMAWSAGNADYERGRVNWGIATDDFFSVYPTGTNPTAIITPATTSQPFCDKHGIGQLRLAYEAPYFYFILFYGHNRPIFSPFSVLAYRIQYEACSSPGNCSKPATWGLGTVREIFKGGQWVPHDGRLVFDYDSPPPTGLPVHGNYDACGFWYAGEGDLKFDPVRQRWIHIFSMWENDAVWWQESPSLGGCQWTTPVQVDVSKVRQQYPSTPFVGAGLWYGDITNDNITNPRMYVFLPIHGGPPCPGNIFGGLSIAMATLDWVP